jgi:hypothetical protein
MPEVHAPDEIGAAPLIHDAVIGDDIPSSRIGTSLNMGPNDVIVGRAIQIPDDSTSRLHRAPRTDPDDVTTAGDRIVKFWAKYKDGRIEPTVDTTYRDDVAIHMATVKVWKNGDSDKPDVTAHATRATNDPDPITAERAQETAETAALSRALRYLGILANPPKTS